MNIIYMHTHDTGKYIEPYGYPASTPHLMELARRGTLFRKAFSASPTCSPSRAALMTGLSPHACGMNGLVNRGFRLPDYAGHLVQHLNRSGYDTVLSGIQHEAPDPSMIGYRQVLSGPRPPGKHAEWDLDNARRAARFIGERTAKDKPFFLSFGMFNTHRPFPDIAPDIHPGYIVPPFPLADAPPNRFDMAGFHTSLRTVDACVGIVTDAVREAGLQEQTVLLFTTDHGLPFPQMKCTLYDTGIEVSLILVYPGGPPANVVDALVSQIDLFPTLCELAGVGVPERREGRSLLPLLEGRTERIRDELFAEVTYHAAYEPMRCVRTERYKYIRNFDDHHRIPMSNIGDSPSKTYMAEHGYAEERKARDMLFDLALDPVERINRCGDPGYDAVRKDLSGRLQAWMERTGDPLLEGRVPRPAGTQVNTLECFSALTDEFER